MFDIINIVSKERKKLFRRMKCTCFVSNIASNFYHPSRETITNSHHPFGPFILPFRMERRYSVSREDSFRRGGR